jgi:hypothetical protein
MQKQAKNAWMSKPANVLLQVANADSSVSPSYRSSSTKQCLHDYIARTDGSDQPDLYPYTSHDLSRTGVLFHLPVSSLSTSAVTSWPSEAARSVPGAMPPTRHGVGTY